MRAVSRPRASALLSIFLLLGAIQSAGQVQYLLSTDDESHASNKYKTLESELLQLKGKAAIQECLIVVTGHTVKHPCLDTGVGELDGGPSAYLLPPYPLAPQIPFSTDPSRYIQDAEDRTEHPVLSALVPAELVENGEAALKNLDALVKSGKLQGCPGFDCVVYLRGVFHGSRTSKVNAACHASISSGVLFPALDTCRVLSLEESGRKWLRAIVKTTGWGGGFVESWITMGSAIHLELRSASQSTDFVQYVRRGVSQPPLALRTDSSGGPLVAVADWRTSTILPDHKEQIEITISVVQKGVEQLSGGPIYYFDLTINPEVLISWRPIFSERAPPTPEQASAYRSAITRVVIQSLMPVCNPIGANEQTVLYCK